MIKKVKYPLIIFDTLLILIIGYFMAGVLFYPKSEEPVKFAGITQTENEATESAKTKEEVSKIAKKEETPGQTKGTTQYVAPTNYQPTAKSKTSTKKLTQAKETIEKPKNQTLPDISDQSQDDDYPFSDEHTLGYNNTLNEIEDIINAVDTMYLQLLELEREYYSIPETVTNRSRGFRTQSQLDSLIEVEQTRVLREYNILVADYNLLDFRLDQLNRELCSTYYDVLVYYGYQGYCN